MDQAKILVVEDEPIVAKDIQQSLRRLGYEVPATATSGEEALRKAGETKPDLVIMDIVLKGQMDGVETAQHLKERFDVPIVYLTAYADHQTLERAKTTAPAGYMLKPYQPNELRTTVELALHRSQIDRHLKESLRWLATTVQCSGDAVITTNRVGRVTYLSPAAETLTGWEQQEAAGVDLAVILSLDETRSTIDSPAKRAMAERRMIRMEEALLLGRDGAAHRVQGSAAPVVDDAGGVVGAVLVFRPYAQRISSEPSGHSGVRWPEDRTLARPAGVINLCAWCKRVPDSSGQWYDLETFISEHSDLTFNGGLCPECMARCFPSEHHSQESLDNEGRI